MVRIGVSGAHAIGHEVAIRRDLRQRPPDSEDAHLEVVVDGSGHVMLLAEVNGLGCATAWEETTARIRQKADPDMDDQTAAWLRVVHMNVTMAYCLIGHVAQDDHAPKRILAAAAGRALPRPSDAIEQRLDEIRRLCEVEGITSLWAFFEVANRSDDEDTASVQLGYESTAGSLPYGGVVVAEELGRIIGYAVELHWGDAPPEGNPRELLQTGSA